MVTSTVVSRVVVVVDRTFPSRDTGPFSLGQLVGWARPLDGLRVQERNVMEVPTAGETVYNADTSSPVFSWRGVKGWDQRCTPVQCTVCRVLCPLRLLCRVRCPLNLPPFWVSVTLVPM